MILLATIFAACAMARGQDFDLSLHTFWTQLDDNRSGGVDKLELTRFVAITAVASEFPLPTSDDEDGGNKLLRTLIDTTFSNYDKDMTGEIELDELDDALVTDILGKYLEGTGSSISSLM
ncbi:hypothetical protein AURANDRAFT_67513 [Aureococcus anophagefferens]|uniref:EF-hand domain-containing protein n=1 Tax=Aureococcus anophagefferens TaxID=44056 RepID=F0YLE6_AURAN|nr:hypothetical protein AURANDRAFT_67513 [Aureococcus anophagefferens]XP_009042181.1 hypothetical protein AURANDRAFT_68284 [Aureococcus anophagefferens]EGB03122.1 hypothetical protein AURANDRAFT_68284 [Aureococcus anophagefferens]EGB04097.1 hypothetical protein AURANDRAFT_67513 [Aureococcus anophagefferens]|eukprot:XP_009041222.1 hypothetical protein AURANDRAFT_67513 [Aureococcus anophagefferens]